MPKVNDLILDTGDAFPNIEVDLVGGGKISIVDHLKGSWGWTLFGLVWTFHVFFLG